MADLTITAANVDPAANATIERGTAGATITRGQAVYIDATDSNKLKLADGDLSDAAAAVVGISLSDVAADQEMIYITKGDLDPGATVVLGEFYVASGTAGGIAPIGDYTTGDRATLIGVGTSTSNINLFIKAWGVTRA